MLFRSTIAVQLSRYIADYAATFVGINREIHMEFDGEEESADIWMSASDAQFLLLNRFVTDSALNAQLATLTVRTELAIVFVRAIWIAERSEHLLPELDRSIHLEDRGTEVADELFKIRRVAGP